MKNTRLISIVLIFVFFSLLLYMVPNALMFKREYERQSLSQLQELAQIIKKEMEYALDFGIPITSLGGMDRFLKGILDNTQELSLIQVKTGETILFEAKREKVRVIREFQVPIITQGQIVGRICLSMGNELYKQTYTMLFDLITIVIAGLIITYEIIRFFSSKLVTTPFYRALSCINAMARDMDPYKSGEIPGEFESFFDQVRSRVIIRNRQLQRLRCNMDHAASIFLSRVFHGRQAFMAELKKRRAALDHLARGKEKLKVTVDPSQIRPVVFLFFMGANFQASFLPLYSKQLLTTPTFLDGFFSSEILMGLPITCHMFTVFFVMMFMGSAAFNRWIPLHYNIGIGTFFSAAGLVMGGLSGDIVQLTLSRMLGAIGFAFIVVYTKQYIVEHTTEKNRAKHLAGFTAAFSGGLFCSVIIGSILVDYFSYRFTFFCAAAIVLLIYLFDYMILSDKTHGARETESSGKENGLGEFFRTGLSDTNLICIFVHGIFTRITFIGFYYYAIPIFLKPDFSFGNIGRIMMFYTLPAVFLGSIINKHIKKTKQSKTSVVGSNILVGLILVMWPFSDSGPLWFKSLYVILALLLLGISNSITFPAQTSLLVDTRTAQTLGRRTALSVYSSFERIGSALGPVFYGYFAACYDITWAIVSGGILCIVGNLIFLGFFKVIPENDNPKPLKVIK